MPYHSVMGVRYGNYIRIIISSLTGVPENPQLLEQDTLLQSISPRNLEATSEQLNLQCGSDIVEEGVEIRETNIGKKQKSNDKGKYFAFIIIPAKINL